MSEERSVDVTLVVPAKDEERTVAELFEMTRRTLEESGRSFEIIFIDDGSTDSTLAELRGLAKGDARVRVVSFLKNFGKAAALAAGFERARGEIIVTMDADLQDDPLEIPRFIEAIEEGAHLVSGWKKERRDPLGRRAASKVFNAITAVLSGVRVHDMNCGFKAYRRQVIESIDIYGDLHRFIPALAAARGFTVTEIPVRHHPREHGKSRYGIERIPRGFFDLLTVLMLTQYAKRPLHLFGAAGVTVGGLGFLALAYLTVLWFLGERPVGTRPLFMGGILLMLLGAQVLSLGLVSELITSLTHRRDDQYIVREEIGP